MSWSKSTSLTNYMFAKGQPYHMKNIAEDNFFEKTTITHTRGYKKDQYIALLPINNKSAYAFGRAWKFLGQPSKLLVIIQEPLV